WIVQEDEIVRSGVAERGDAGNAPIKRARSMRGRTGQRRDLAGTQPAWALEEQRLRHLPVLTHRNRVANGRDSLEFGAAAEPDLLEPVVAVLGQRIGVIEPQR